MTNQYVAGESEQTPDEHAGMEGDFARRPESDLGRKSSAETEFKPVRPLAKPLGQAFVELRDIEVRWVDAHLPELTGRERQVLYEIVAGGTNEAVAERMDVKLPTLRTHLMRLNQKLGTSSKADLVRLVLHTLMQGYRAGRLHADEPARR
jgi:DNA-binding CsgD family transcriptional regulator